MYATCDNDESIHDTCYVLQCCLPLQLTVACYLGSVPMFPGTYVPRYRCSPVFFTLMVVISLNCLQSYFSSTIAGWGLYLRFWLRLELGLD